jgi:hypothetical protein
MVEEVGKDRTEDGRRCGQRQDKKKMVEEVGKDR